MLDSLSRAAAPSNTTIIDTIIEYKNFFVSVPGEVIGGWVGFGIFIALLLLTAGLAFAHFVPTTADAYQLCLFCFVMLVVYLLAACEQFILERFKHHNVNLMMVFINGVVWLWLVHGTGRRLTRRPAVAVEQFVIFGGIISQLMFLISAFVWDGVVFALWSLGFVVMTMVIASYSVQVAMPWPPQDTYSRHWIAFMLTYSVYYVLMALLSHLYLGVVSLSGAVWAYLVMHVGAYAWLVYSSRNPRNGVAGPGAINGNGYDLKVSPFDLEMGDKADKPE